MVSKRVRIIHWWRRTGMALRVAVLVLGVLFFSLLVYLQRPEDQDAYLSSNIVVFALVNINICFIGLLAFLVGRNVVKLIFDRRRNILGSKLRMRLVTSFVGLALVPTAFLFILASGLLNEALGGWFNKQVDGAISSSVAIARQHYDSLGLNVYRAAEFVASEIKQKPLIYRQERVLKEFLREQRSRNNLFSVSVYDQNGQEILKASHVAAGISSFQEPPVNQVAFARADKKGKEILREENGSNQFIRAYVRASYQDKPSYVVATLRVPPETVESFLTINDAYKEFVQLKLFKNPIRSGYLITFSLITGLILFAAIWIGFYIAREISIPIQRLAEGTQAVARGEYDFQVRVTGDDEVAYLVQSFNNMTADIRQSRYDAEQRRVLIETIMSRLAVGVIALDRDSCITSVNPAAARMFGLSVDADYKGQKIREVITLPGVDALMRVIDFGASSVDELEPEQPEIELEVSIDGQQRQLIGTAGHVSSDSAVDLGSVLIFDDITDLIQAQQMAAWREVARRIAHEIKNPLTPLQLCAQRLKKLLSSSEHSKAVSESTDMIVEHVASIKRLADEFSKFARMPTIQYELTDLNSLLSAVVSRYAETERDITFTFIADGALPRVQLDREQMRRAIINVLDNAVSAFEGIEQGGQTYTITVKTDFREASESVLIEVADTGIGIAQDRKHRIFEPYFTTREKGTGLGLAIVSSIIADHGGRSRVFDNAPQGTRFVIEIPIAPRETRKRKI